MVPEEQYTCVRPFAFRSDYEQAGLDSPCQLTCPFTLWPEEEFRKVQLASTIFSFISIFSLLFVLTTWFARCRHQRYRSERIDPAILHLALALLIAAISDVMPTFRPGGWQGMECQGHEGPNKFDYVNQSSDALCAVTGSLRQFGYLASVYWWACLGFNLFWVSWKLRKFTLCGSSLRAQILQSFIGYGIPALTVVVALSLGEIGADTAFMNCWIMGKSDKRLSFWFFYYHMVFVLVVAGPGVLFAMFSLYRTRKRAGSTKKRQGQLRLAAFLGLLIINFVIILTYKFYLYQNQDKLLSEYGAEVVCSVTPGASSDSCDAVFSPPSISLFAWNACLIGINGFLLFCVFGTTRSTLNFWRGQCSSRGFSGTTATGSSGSGMDAAFSDDSRKFEEVPGKTPGKLPSSDSDGEGEESSGEPPLDEASAVESGGTELYETESHAVDLHSRVSRVSTSSAD